ncbi:MAG TPA: LTA synthase family protein [Candidatus Anaerotruncus excrementipullorum]|uniref:LTA synthase family protein n=1 Tax=Candidatus Anaerotruncus excrementipullorum TaxID=2838465 RepID=A0A9D1WRN9_9FIRM|nr:LTA synthase family protein [Candidatus Anaerotruncus excrementipullorum]
MQTTLFSRENLPICRGGSPRQRLRPLGIVFFLLVPLAALLTSEWIQRGSLESFFPSLASHTYSYLLAWIFLAAIYAAVTCLSGCHWLGVLVLGVLTALPAAVTYFKLEMRGEPFFPWDLFQLSEASGVVGKANLEIQPPMVYTILLFLLLLVVAARFLRQPRRQDPRRWQRRMACGGVSLLVSFGMVWGVYLQPAVTQWFGIIPDMWMQDRYYRNYGLISSFMSNLQALDVSAPEDYSQEAVEQLKGELLQNPSPEPFYPDSYAAKGDGRVTQPNIIFVMNESFWDVTELEGITYDQPVTPNLQRLKGEAAVGKAYSPSFGGGTCDVEFEALTGYSMEFLPSGSKPYQQHVTHDMLATPSFLKSQGYDTLAVHGYYRKYWSRDTAYPHLGIDKFIAAEDFENPEKKRSYYWGGGLITDGEMARRIIQEYENRDPSKPLFLHAVTMQNHTSYNEKNYPEEELVEITSAPEGLSQGTLSQLRDFATGIREADAMLGTLVDYFSQVEEPTILVFWGDHYNPVGKGYELYEKTGYIDPGDTASPMLHGTPLVVWSNYYQEPVDLGTVAAYEISPVVMDLYGLERPPLYSYLIQQLNVYRARTRGITVQPDGSFSDSLTEEQQAWFDNHWLLQYDGMFGEDYLNTPGGS